MRELVNIGIIGVGELGSVCCEVIERLVEKANLVAVADIIEERAKEVASKLNIDWYTDYKKLLERDDIEAVFIITPHYLHAEQTIAAAKARKHVLCAKPIAETLEKADKMIEAARKADIILGIEHFMRGNLGIRKVKELIEEEIGKVFLVNSSIHLRRPPEYWACGPWRGKLSEAGGGVVMINGIHEIDIFRWLFGPVDSVVANIDHQVQKFEVEDVASAILKFKNGIHLNLNASTSILSSKAPTMQIFGTGGTIAIVQGKVLLYKGNDWKDVTPLVRVPDSDYWSSRAFKPWIVGIPPDQGIAALKIIFDDFLISVTQNKKPMVSGEEGRNALEIVEAIYRSAKEGRKINLPL